MPTPEPIATPSAAPNLTPAPTPTAAPPTTVDIATARDRAVGSEVTVEGTVTVQAGPLLGDRTLVIQDATAGIPVRLPSTDLAGAYARGSIVRATGELAQPYGNLELRPGGVEDIATFGSGGLPDAASLGTGGLKETNEGILASLTATITSVDSYDSGAVSIGIADAAGEGKIYAFGPVGLGAGDLKREQRVRAVGIVGQRASSSGAADGYRLWLRDTGDLTILADTPTPAPSMPPLDDGGSTDPKPTRVRIAEAAEGDTVVIVGVVTSKAGLIDSEGRRVTVQDRSGAILVRYPADTTPARVGSVIRAVGEVGTWFGTRQIEAEKTPRRKRGGTVRATGLNRPPTEADEWRLVRVSVRVTDVERADDTWRAEAELADGSSLPIVGLAGAGIDGELLEPGRSARISGIVRRAHPSATDQRFAVAPRSRKDIRLGRLDEVDRDDDDDDGDDDDDEDRVLGVASDGPGSELFAATFGSLAGLEDRLVRVGGRVEAVADRSLTLDDGTGQGTVRFADGVEQLEPGFQLGEVVNAVGRVQRHRQRGAEVVVDSAADVRRAASLTGRGSVPGPGALGVIAPDRAEIPSDPTAAGSPPPASEKPFGAWALLAVGVLALVSASLFGSAGFVAWRSSRTAPVGDHQ